MHISRGYVLLLAAALMVGCGGGNSSKSPFIPAEAGQSGCGGHATNVFGGHITKADGSPLSGADVEITNNTFSLVAEVSYDTKSDARGAYCQPVKAEGNSYNIFPSYSLNWQGAKYTFDLAPRDGHPTDQRFTPGKPVVQDFSWQVQGTDYGGTLQPRATNPTVAGLAPRTAIPAGATVELQLQPDGPLVDGSPNKPQTFRIQFPANSSEAPDIPGVPIGAYTASARMIDASGRATPLLVTALFNHQQDEPGYVKPLAPAATTRFYFDSSLKLGSVTHGVLPAQIFFLLPR